VNQDEAKIDQGKTDTNNETDNLEAWSEDFNQAPLETK
jgi:hypothetical protein